MSLKIKKPIAFIDIEATGINVATERIVEIAMLKLNVDGSKELLTKRMDPGMPIPPEASMIHGIYDEDVKGLPKFRQLAGEINEFLENCDLAGYNSNRFDIPILVEEFLRADILFDTKQRKFIDVFRIFTLMEKRDLTSAYKFYCEKELENAHSAEADITATFEVLEAQLSRYPTKLQNNVDFLHDFTQDGDFVDFGRRMIMKDGEPVFNFGKHKGRKVKDVLDREPQYYDWIMKSDFMLHTKQKLKEIKLMYKMKSF